MEIKVLITGGTIAKRYDEISGELRFDSGHLEKILTQGRCEAKLDVETLMMKDSLEMDDSDRERIYEAVNTTPQRAIMITHGTDTMVETAVKLSAIQDKTIVLVGAMIPFAFKNSDALFNVGCALGALRALEAGVYVVMNGQIFTYNAVQKDKKRGIFIPKA